MTKYVTDRKTLHEITSENAESLGLKKIGTGEYGVCYLDEKNGIVYKLFKITPSTFSSISPLCLAKLKRIKIDRISFPINIIKNNTEIKGITYNYIKGESLENFIKKRKEFTAQNFIKYYTELIRIIPYLDKSNIEIVDLHIGNIIINEDGFYIIDIDGWHVSKYYNYTLNNIIKINETMREFIIACNFVFDDPNQIIKDKKDFKAALTYILQLIPLNYDLAYIISEIQYIIQTSITYDDLIESMYAFADSTIENGKKHK